MAARGRLLAGLAAALAGVAAFVYFKREALVLDFLAARVTASSIEEREALLAPAMEFLPPEGVAPPYPVVIQLHGCAGPRAPFMAQWARVANDAGFMAVIVDSHAPRGISRAEALETVCKGTRLLGQERAGDALAAYEIVRKRSDVDVRKIVFAGWSHGAWSAMDLVALDPPHRWPAGLRREAIAPLDIAGLVGVYPYCGRGAWTKAIGWRAPVKALMLVAGADTVVDPSECPALAERLKRRGVDIEAHVFEGVDHVFDDPYLEPEFQHFYNAAAHQDATRRYRAFLDEIAAQ